MVKGNMLKVVAAIAFAAIAFAAYPKSNSYSIYYGDGDVVEPGDSLSFSVEDLPDEISGREVLYEYLPDGLDIEWTGKKFKTPKSASPTVKKIDGEYEIVVSEKGEDNPCSLKFSYNKKKGKVTGSFKLYTCYETSKGKLKLKSYTAKISGTLGSDSLRVTIKKVGTFTASLY